MKKISTKARGTLDYLTSVLLMTMPWIFDFKEVVAATWLFLAVGMTMFLMALFTDYERGMVRGLSMQLHLRLIW